MKCKAKFSLSLLSLLLILRYANMIGSLRRQRRRPPLNPAFIAAECLHPNSSANFFTGGSSLILVTY
ncbi:unnamed protein product [Citrullus colocynthis]|uniref:Secreted protein n=1 Tax=Citrullus colocynthis TaxID=252529 RepID=A0ABP0Z4F4_9ROSI